MIEAAREMLDMVKHMPEYTLWVLAGILFYKVFFVGSWIAVARLLITKIHDAFMNYKPRAKVIEYDCGGALLNDQSKDSAGDLIRAAKTLGNLNSSYASTYIHSSDLREAINLIEKEIVLKKEKKK